jgi:hypothetical protein
MSQASHSEASHSEACRFKAYHPEVCHPEERFLLFATKDLPLVVVVLKQGIS